MCAFVIDDGAVFSEIVEQIAMAINGRIHDHGLRSRGRIAGFTGRNRECIIESQS